MCNMGYHRHFVIFSAVALIALLCSTTAFQVQIGRSKSSTIAPHGSPILRHRFRQQQPQQQQHVQDRSIGCTSTSSTSLFMSKLWDRLEIEEDDEPMWYLLNCIAGVEMDLLRQCRQRCEGMEDVEKFVLPTTKKIRSHGKNRMVTETKTNYQGYVFAKLRLCAETYEAIQDLDLCRSWMGTINHKGYKKLPPSPVALNEDEIEKFGLEDLEAEEADEVELEQVGIILDTAEKDAEDELQAKEQAEVAIQVYQGLRVEDMVKVTKPGKLFKEDGIVRRLKDGKIMVRFFTYGQMYEEWMEPGDVRLLDEMEVIKGLTGPNQPITQRDFDGPQHDDSQNDYRSPRQRGNAFGGGPPGAGGPRNRREDRTASRFRDNRAGEDERNEKNWNWYKENQRGNQAGGYSDGDDVFIRGSNDRNREQGDVDSQWGRGRPPPQRNNPRSQDPRRRQPDTGRPSRPQNQNRKDQNDWSAFVSPSSSSSKSARSKDDSSDDFFSSLMSDLSNDLNPGKNSGQSPGGDGPSSGGASSAEEDDFFASLMSEISDEGGTDTSSNPGSDSGSFKQQQKAPAAAISTAEDDFFSSLEQELGDSLGDADSKSGTTNDADDFFAALAEDIGTATESKASAQKRSKQHQPAKAAATKSSEEDFFSSLENELGASTATATSSSEEDFFSSLEKELGPSTAAATSGSGEDFFSSLEKELGTSTATATSSSEEDFNAEGVFDSSPEDSAGSKPKKASVAPATREANGATPPASLEKLTVPALKDMLRERGMKVSGNKASLIERLKSE